MIRLILVLIFVGCASMKPKYKKLKVGDSKELLIKELGSPKESVKLNEKRSYYIFDKAIFLVEGNEIQKIVYVNKIKRKKLKLLNNSLKRKLDKKHRYYLLDSVGKTERERMEYSYYRPLIKKALIINGFNLLEQEQAKKADVIITAFWKDDLSTTERKEAVYNNNYTAPDSYSITDGYGNNLMNIQDNSNPYGDWSSNYAGERTVRTSYRANYIKLIAYSKDDLIKKKNTLTPIWISSSMYFRDISETKNDEIAVPVVVYEAVKNIGVNNLSNKESKFVTDKDSKFIIFQNEIMEKN
ncbi:hypothetical protein N9N67_01625 [Bacteriovoracaceae bacterium]|nr:hypothetical protein [Bacteriovoracaceae bacterium]